MKSRHLIISLIVLSLMLLATQACQAQYVARVSALKGRVQMTSKSQKTGKMETNALGLYDGVDPGAKIVAAKNASLRLLFYSDTHEETINGPCTITAAKEGSVLKKGAKSSVKITRKTPLFALVPNPSEEGRSIAAGIGGARTALHPEAKKNSLTKVVAALADGSPRPTFTWSVPITGEPWYLFIVRESGKPDSRDIVRAVSKTNSFTIPDSSPALEPGKKYRCIVSAWQIDPESPKCKNDENRYKMESNEYKAYEFVMPSKEVLAYFLKEQKKIDSLKQESPEWNRAGLALLSLYLDYGMFDKARELAGKFPDRWKNTFFQDIEDRCPKK